MSQSTAASSPTRSAPIKVAVAVAVSLLVAGALYLIPVRGLAIFLDLSALAGMLCF